MHFHILLLLLSSSCLLPPCHPSSLTSHDFLLPPFYLLHRLPFLHLSSHFCPQFHPASSIIHRPSSFPLSRRCVSIVCFLSFLYSSMLLHSLFIPPLRFHHPSIPISLQLAPSLHILSPTVSSLFSSSIVLSPLLSPLHPSLH